MLSYQNNKKTAVSWLLVLPLRIFLGFFAIDQMAVVQAFSASRLNSRWFPTSSQKDQPMPSSRLWATDDAAAFGSFAASLGEEDGTVATTAATKAPPQKETKTLQQQWQLDMDELLDPRTDLGRRQVLLSDLLQESGDIREAVLEALRNGKIDPLLTPRVKQLQDGTRAVARQLTSDILPSLRQRSASRSSSSVTPPLPPFIPPPPPLPQPEEIGKVGSRVLSALKNQVQSNLEQLQSDLQNPERIPERLQQNTKDLVQEASNVFSEMPAGLEEPPYTVEATFADYEIRRYDGYKVATTNMAQADETYDADDLGQAGAAFNSLASYLFGANQEGKAMSMTTPVQTTLSGEMRFYLAESGEIPDPLQQDEAANLYETGNILIQDIPPARLAVRRFTGFCTRGEIARQKEALLAALALDDSGYALDVEHGQTVGHVLFQYNPPYTLPVLRRNEIAVPVVESDEAEPSLESQWSTSDATTSPTTTTVNGSTTASAAVETEL